MKLLIAIMILLSLLMCALPPFAAKLAEEVHVPFTEVLPSDSSGSKKKELSPAPTVENDLSIVDSSTDAGADDFEQLAELTMLTERVQAISQMAESARELTLTAPSRIKVYMSSSESEEGVIREMTWEEYLTGVVLAEMGAYSGEEALKAQAVACHSYALYRMNAGSYASHRGADVCTDSRHCTAYKTYEDYAAAWGEQAADAALAKISAAVAEVADYVLTYEGEVCNAMFHASSGDMTEAAASLWECDLPYLAAVASMEQTDRSCVTLRAAELKSRLSGLGIAFSGDASLWIGTTEHSIGGRVASLQICGSTLSGATLRSRLGLRSTDFTVSYADDTFTFVVEGYGHGIGMSQAGAAAMAELGADWRTILAHYYTGSVTARTVSR